MDSPTKKLRFATYSGQLIDIVNLKTEHIHLVDIAHHLSKVQRFNGATESDIYYSVGEHSINLANYFIKTTPSNTHLIRMALLHDASESYMSDVVSPVKNNLSDYQYIEQKVQALIYRKYMQTHMISRYENELKIADKRILIDEAEILIPHHLYIYQGETGLTKLGCHIEYNNHPGTVKNIFLSLCKKYSIFD